MNRKNIVLEPRISIPPEIIAAFDRDDIGYNLLVKGTAGCGKTTFAMSLLSYFTQFTPVYLSTRVAPSSIYSQFPWLKDRLKAENIIDATRTYLPPTNDIDSNNMKNHLKQTIRFQSVEEFLEIMYKKVKQYERPILVIDSWDAIFGREDDLNINVENLFTEFIRQTNAKLILISESELNDNFLEYIVDGVITLKDDEIEGRPFRILQINKIRAVVRHQKAYAFTVYKNRFQYNFPYMPHRLEEISQFKAQEEGSEKLSTGNMALDVIYNGGLRPGTFNLLEVESSVPVSAISSIFIGLVCQFISNERGAIIKTIDGINSDLLQKKRLFLYLKTKDISQNLRIMQTKILDRKEIRPYIRQTDESHYNDDFFDTYSKLSSITKFQPVFAGSSYDFLSFKSDYRSAMKRFQEHLKLIRNSNIVELGIVNSERGTEQNGYSKDLSYVSSTHIKIIERNGAIFMYSIKPRSSCLYQLNTSYNNGYPEIELLPIV